MWYDLDYDYEPRRLFFAKLSNEKKKEYHDEKEGFDQMILFLTPYNICNISCLRFKEDFINISEKSPENVNK